jgi:hypothetical protein
MGVREESEVGGGVRVVWAVAHGSGGIAAVLSDGLLQAVTRLGCAGCHGGSTCQSGLQHFLQNYYKSSPWRFID